MIFRFLFVCSSRCSREMKGYASTTCKTGTADGKCDVDNISTMIESDCLFCPDSVQPLNASIMGLQYIPSVSVKNICLFGV